MPDVGPAVRVVAEREQRRDVAVGLQPDVAAVAAVAAVGTALGDVGLALSAALLPRWARRLYHLPGWPTTDLTATLAARALRTATLTMPARVRQSPYHRAALQRVGIPQGT